MFLLVLLSTVLAGAPELFKRTTFFIQPDSIVPNSLESRVLQLKSVEDDFTSFTTDLLNWGKKYHSFRMGLEKEMLAEVLSHTGQADFSKELAKCGMVDNMETEDMITVKNVCYSETMATDLIETLLKELRTKAETCVNVKEKFRKRIGDAYEEYFEVEATEVEQEESDIEEDSSTVRILLQIMAEQKQFAAIASKSSGGLQEICEEYKDLANQVNLLTQSTNSILSELF